MPTVPMIDQTAAPDAPFTAGSVAPVRNAAPEQQQAMGQATQQAGEFEYKTGQTIGNALADQVDEATVKQAVTAFHSTASNLLYDPQSGYLHQLGQAAIDGAGPAKQAIAKAQQDGLGGLDNPIQKMMFQQATKPALTEFGTDIDNHNYTQTTQFAGESAVNLAQTATAAAIRNYDSYGQTDGDGSPTGDFSSYVATAENQTRHASLIMKGAPAGSDVSNTAVLNLHSQIATGALSQMMTARAPYTAIQRVYDDMKAKGWLNLDAADQMGRAVKTYVDQEANSVIVNQQLSDAQRASQGQPTSSVGTPDYQFPAKGGAVTAQPYNADEGAVALNLPQGSNIQTPADGKVVAVGKDENGTFGMGIQHPDGSVTTFSGIAASGLKVGDQVQRGEDIATASPTVLWSLADKNGNTLDPTKAGLPPVDLSKITDEKVLDNALAGIRAQITDPHLQQQAATEAEIDVRRNQQNLAAAKSQLFSQASNQFYSNWNWKDIDPALFAQLAPEQQQQFKDKQTEHVLQQYNEGQAFRTMGETDLVSDFTANPETITTDNVEAARPQLSRATYLQLMNKAQELQRNPAGVYEAQAVNERVKYYAGQAGINVNPKTAADKQTLTDLTFQVQRQIDQIKTQNHGKATPDQVDSAIQNELIQRTVTTPSRLFEWTGLGNPNSTAQRFNFQRPDGATQIGTGKEDGKQHYFDANGRDLGLVQ